MKSLHTEIGIGAPAHIVWEVISDLDGWSAWNPIMKASGTLAQGEQLDVKLDGAGAEFFELAGDVGQERLLMTQAV